jgi:ankyrin repeat protein
MKLLIANNAQIDVTDDRGRTPLILAVMQSDTISMKILLDSGCQKFVRDDDDKSAEDYAKGKLELLDLLKGGKIQSKSFILAQDKKIKLLPMQSLSFSENSQLFKPAKQKLNDEANDQETLHTNREFSELDEKFNNIDTWNDSDGESDMIVEAIQPPKIDESTDQIDIIAIDEHEKEEGERDEEENRENNLGQIIIPTYSNNDYDENFESLSNRQNKLKQQKKSTKTIREGNYI